MDIVKNCGCAYCSKTNFQRKTIHRIKNNEDQDDWGKCLEKCMTISNSMFNNEVNVWGER